MKELAKCPNCGKQNKITAKFCEGCGTALSDVTATSAPEESKSTSGGPMGWWNKQSTKGKAVIGIVGICCLGLILIVGIGGLMSPDQTTSNVQVNTTQSSNATPTASSSQTSSSDTQGPIAVQNLKVKSGGYGDYDVTCTLIPNQDESYLEMATIWYDSSGAVIEQDPLSWNIDNAKAGQTYKVTGSSYISDKGTPVKVDVLIFDSVFSGGDASDAIYKQTLTV